VPSLVVKTHEFVKKILEPAKPRRETQAAAAVRLGKALGIGVTRQMVRKWKAKGYPLDDPEELGRCLWNQERRPKGLKRPKDLESVPAVRPDVEGLDQEQVEKELRELYEKLRDAEDYEEARTRRTQIAGVKDVLKELREQGRYILREEAAKSAAVAAMASKGKWEQIEDELPPMLEGLTALQMKEKLRPFARRVIMELAEVFDR
jgi:hypothetical protein